ncbi:11320_t:CDS:2 [Funneliformis mosseae]|uniref:11320_t:CDS:1 n=1 Tax=Funneliformis mosseae TaxID=27381 RepID=A0A9N8Z7V5_FUNMO|nr:11320_t:CDS:2 [Funneliformis mosseae]
MELILLKEYVLRVVLLGKSFSEKRLVGDNPTPQTLIQIDRNQRHKTIGLCFIKLVSIKEPNLLPTRALIDVIFAGQTLPDSDALWVIKASRDQISYNDMFSLQHKSTDTLIGRESAFNEHSLYNDYIDGDFADHVEG